MLYVRSSTFSLEFMCGRVLLKHELSYQQLTSLAAYPAKGQLYLDKSPRDNDPAALH